MGITLLTDALCLAALLLWGLFLCRRLRLALGFGPVLGVAACLVLGQAAGAVNLLWPGLFLFLLLPFCWLAYALRREGRGVLAGYFTAPGVAAFLAACALLAVVYAVKTPRFQTWDEFSHWGVFFKTAFYDHRFAVWVPERSFQHQSYPQGGAALYSLFALLKPAYAERDVFFAVNTLLFSSASALFAALPALKSRAGRAGQAALTAVAVPLLFAVFSPDTPYTTAYMDAPVGALFAAALALAVYLPGSKASPVRASLALGLLCAALATVKEIGAVFALCILGILALQILGRLFCRRGLAPAGALRAAGAAFLPAAALTGGSVLLWKLALLLANRTTDQFSSMGLGYFLQCWQEARTGVDPYFYDVWGVFYARIRTYPLLFGWSAVKLGAVFGVLGLALAVGLWRCGRRRAALAPVLMLGYFPCYLAVLFYVYIGGMTPYEAMRAASWDRYICCYFIAWGGLLLVCLFLLLAALAQRQGGKFPAPALASALCGVLAAGSVLTLTQNGLAAFVLEEEPWRDVQIAQAAALHNAILADGGSTDSAVWLLSADSETAYQTMWYYHYELCPDNVCIETPSSQEGVDVDYNLGEHSIDYLVLFGVTPEFEAVYGSRFSDGLAAAQAAEGAPALYRRTAENNFAPVATG